MTAAARSRRRTLRLHDALQKMQCNTRLDTCKWHAVAIMCTGITRMADACVYIVHVGLGEQRVTSMTLRFWSFGAVSCPKRQKFSRLRRGRPPAAPAAGCFQCPFTGWRRDPDREPSLRQSLPPLSSARCSPCSRTRSCSAREAIAAVRPSVRLSCAMQT